MESYTEERMKERALSKYSFDKYPPDKRFIIDYSRYRGPRKPLKIFCTHHKDFFTYSRVDKVLMPFGKYNHLVTCPVCKFGEKKSFWYPDKYAVNVVPSVSYSGPVAYPKGFEVLTKKGWIRIEDYIEGEAIAVYNKESYLEFEVPEEYMKKKNIEYIKCVRDTSELIFPKHGRPMFKFVNVVRTFYKKIYYAVPTYMFYARDWIKKSEPGSTAILRVQLGFKEEAYPFSEEHFLLLINMYFKRHVYAPGRVILNPLSEEHFKRLLYLTEKVCKEYPEVTYEVNKVGESSIIVIYNLDSLCPITEELPDIIYYAPSHYKTLAVDEIVGSNTRDKRVAEFLTREMAENYVTLYNDVRVNSVSETRRTRFSFISAYTDREGVHRTKPTAIKKTLTPEHEFTEYTEKDYSYNFKVSTGYILLRQNGTLFISTDGKYEGVKENVQEE